VGICVEPGLEMGIGLLGILKAGGAYVPLDPAYPSRRLAFMLEDAQMSVLLTQERLLAGLPEHSTEVLCLDTEWDAIAREGQDNLISEVTAKNLVYVIYTSGSTGTPKGVAIQHVSLVNLATWHQHVYRVQPTDRATQLASLAFDASVWELWPYLTAGASMHIPDAASRATISQLIEWLTAEAITICFLPTPLAEAILAEPWPRRVALRELLTGGDKLHRGPGKTCAFTLVNHYGPTEYTVVTTCAPVAAGTDLDSSPPIGRPIANTQIYLLDHNLQPLPIGVPGELYIGGAGLAQGYLKRPELTAERFIPHPFSNQPGTRLYKTGDLARYLPDGNLEFLGRLDQQVKIRGFRIELGEIEAVLCLHTAVREAVVLAREDRATGKHLVAYLVTNRTLVPASAELRGFLRDKLPDYMLPSAFVRLEALPLTPNGKVDRRALLNLEGQRLDAKEPYVMPQNETEQTIAAMWQGLLHVEKVGIHDNFFDLGGHSLLGTQLISQLRNTFQVEFSLRSLFEEPTVAGIAKTLAVSRKDKQDVLDKIADVLKKLGGIPEEEAKTLLAEKTVGH
jgi:amino acid adenylation domain-containing protein